MCWTNKYILLLIADTINIHTRVFDVLDKLVYSFVDCKYNHLLLSLVCSDIFVLTVMHLILYWEEGISTSALHRTIV